MDEQTKQEITRLLLEQVAIDEAQVHETVIVGKQKDLFDLINLVAGSVYNQLPAGWAIPLYLSRN